MQPSRRRHATAWRTSLAVGAVLAGTALGPLAAVSAAATPPAGTGEARPWVSGDHTIPVFGADEVINEVVDVETGLDGDDDGEVDTIRVDVTRPRTEPGAEVPLIVHASPYFGQSPRSAWETDYFVPRGYAVATVALPGTDFSSGCDDVGGDLEVIGSKAVVDWANGRARGRHLDGSRADATEWTDGKVAMIGVSWDGTIANAVASTGVEGLETIVPVAAISSWYDYTRGNGVPYYDDHVGYLHQYVSNFDSAYCRTLTPVLQAASDDATGSYNPWWSDRNYRIDASKIEASVLVVHGLNDENVRTGQFGHWWDELVENGVERKLLLYQGEHEEPHYSIGAAYDQALTKWFDYYLQGIENGTPAAPQATILREDGSRSTDEVWPPADTRLSKLKLSTPVDRAVGGLSTSGATTDAAQPATVTVVQATARSNDRIVANPTDPRRDRAVFVSSALDDAIRESGTAQVRLRVKVDKPVAGFQARVVDYDADSSFIVSRTMASLNHHAGLDAYETLQAGKYYTLTWDINTDDRIFPAGHRVGLVITAEQQNIDGPYQPVTATIKLAKSWLKVPLTGDGVASVGLDAVPPTVGATVQNAEPVKTVEDFTREFLEGSR